MCSSCILICMHVSIGSTEAERIPVQEARERDGERLHLRPAGEARQHGQRGGVGGDGGERGEAPGAQHPGRVHGADRLRAVGREPTAHPPPRHRDHLRPPGLPRRGVRHHRQQALRPHRMQGRGLRLPARPRPLPEEQRRHPRRGHLGLQQPAAGHAGRRPDPLRRLAGGAHRRAGQGVPDRRRPRGGHQVQVPAHVGTRMLPSRGGDFVPTSCGI
jgi:hypothetical protein